MQGEYEWLPLDIACHHFGYAHKQSLTRRLRQLRQAGHVLDMGRPPQQYQTRSAPAAPPIILMWPNPKVALLRSDASPALLMVKPGKRRLEKLN